MAGPPGHLTGCFGEVAFWSKTVVRKTGEILFQDQSYPGIGSDFEIKKNKYHIECFTVIIQNEPCRLGKMTLTTPRAPARGRQAFSSDSLCGASAGSIIEHFPFAVHGSCYDVCESVHVVLCYFSAGLFADYASFLVS